jgi:TonB family protein
MKARRATLDVGFGVLEDGRLKFVDVVHKSDSEIYDEYAMNAVKLASPFPPAPSEVIDAMKNKTMPG